MKNLLINSLRTASIALLSVAALLPNAVQAATPAASDNLPQLTVSTFPPPTQSFWFTKAIAELGLDRKHGFILNVEPKTSQTAYSDFVSGASQVCYCIAPAAATRFVERGADVAQVWINQSIVSLVVTANPNIRSARDLAGKSLAADTATGAWAIAASLISRSGTDLKSIKVQPASFTNAVLELTTGRVDAAVVNTVDVARLTRNEPGKYRVIDLTADAALSKELGARGIPYWGLGAWNKWIRVPENKALLNKLYAASVELDALIKRDPNKVADVVSGFAKLDKTDLLDDLKQFWGNGLAPASEYEKGFRLLGSDFLPNSKQLDAPLTEANYRTLISDFKPDVPEAARPRTARK